MRLYRMFLPVLALSLVILWGGVEQIQAQTQANPVPATWGAIKALYGQPIEKGVPNGSAMTDSWRYATYREICYALSKDKYNAGDWGASSLKLTNDRGTWYVGDWNYMGLGIGNGGQCKSFASTIVSRATGGYYTLPTGYNYANGPIGDCREGDVIQKRENVYKDQHTAIVFKILARDGNGKATMIDVIDSNYIASNKIGRHVLPYGSDQLSYYNVW